MSVADRHTVCLSTQRVSKRVNADPREQHPGDGSIRKIVKRERQSLDCKLIEFLRDEITLLIESPCDCPVSLIRLHNLLDRMRYHFGPDPQNPCFVRFLRISLKSLNFRVCLLLMRKHYVRLDSLIVDCNVVPDYLFLLFFYAMNRVPDVTGFARFDSSDFMSLVQLLLPVTNVNAYYPSYGMTLADLLVDCIASDVGPHAGGKKPCSQMSVCAEVTLDMLLAQPEFDIRKVINCIRRHANERHAIQRAIDGHKFRVASKLLSKTRGINVNSLIDVTRVVVFTESASALFKSLYFAGFKFESGFCESLLQQQLMNGEEDVARDFCLWLKRMQTRVTPLKVQAWNSLKSHSDQEFLQELTDSLVLPDDVTL